VTERGLACRAAVHYERLDLDVALDVAPGELVALVGPNGAGKSTLLRAIAGLQPIDHGRITLDGVALDDPDAEVFVAANQRQIGIVFQDRLLFDHMTVVENVAFGLRSRGTARADARASARAWLARLGVAELAGARPAELSGGQAQRVALARALAFEPRLLLLDEPFGALDATTRVEVKRDIREHLSTLDIPRVIVTHDPVEAITLGDRIVVLEDGRVTQQGTPDEIRTHPRSTYVANFLGLNLFRGVLRDGTLTLDDGVLISVVDHIRGPVTATIHPNAITLSRGRPEGSARNAWATTVDDVDDEGDRVRVRVAGPIPLTVEITPAARRELAITTGSSVWVSFKATAVSVQPDHAS
jgi:molybdate transport system ATP-binding protein